MDAIGCMYGQMDAEIQQLKREAGPEGWQQMKEKFITDNAKSVGENQARMMWEFQTNIKDIHERTRQRDGHLFGEKNYRGGDATSTPQQQQMQQQQLPPPRDLEEAMGLNLYTSPQTAAVANPSHQEVENMMASITRAELNKRKEQAKKKEKSFWKFGS